jgi:hypothetical protein
MFRSFHQSMSLFQSFDMISQAAGVEAVVNPEGEYTFQAVLLGMKKGRLSLIAKHLNVQSVTALKNVIPEGIPVCLVLNGRGIMHKKLSDEARDPEIIVQEMLPNTKAGDFYIQQLESEKSIFASIARKTSSDELLKRLKEEDIQVINCSFGPFIIHWLLPLLPDFLRHIPVNGFVLEREEHSIKDFVTIPAATSSVLEIGDDTIDSALALAYAAAFQQLLPGVDPLKAEITSVASEKDEFISKKRFKLFGLGLLGVCFFILLVNFLFFTYLSDRNQELVSRQATFQGMEFRYLELEKNVREKETFLKNAGWLIPSRATLLSDRIGASVPASVKLTELLIYPLDPKESRALKKNVFNGEAVRIAGRCSRPTELNPWLRKMDLLSGVAEANVSSYLYDAREGQGNFIITLRLKN